MTLMNKRIRIVAALVVVGIVGATCGRSGGISRVDRAEGEILTIKGKYTLVILSPGIMRQTFGPEWQRLSLFYRSNRAITQDGERAMVSAPMRPLAKGAPILVISGDDWPDLIVAVYALEKRKQAILSINTVEGVIRVLQPTGPRSGEPTLATDGSLVFR